MPQFDQETMVKLVSELRKNVVRLQDLAKLSEADFLKDPDKIGSAKYHFIRLRLNTRQLAAGMKGKANRAEAR